LGHEASSNTEDASLPEHEIDGTAAIHRSNGKTILSFEVTEMFEIWKVTVRPKSYIYLENQDLSSISLLAWHVRGSERHALVLKNNGRLRDIFSKVFSVDASDQIVDALMANRIVNLPGSLTTRQLNALGFHL
jgi:hypothetical protein